MCECAFVNTRSKESQIEMTRERDRDIQKARSEN